MMCRISLTKDYRNLLLKSKEKFFSRPIKNRRKQKQTGALIEKLNFSKYIILILQKHAGQKKKSGGRRRILRHRQLW